jgi:lysozyme
VHGVNYLQIVEEQLRRDEGTRRKPYRDSVGKLTIGVGRNLDDVGLNDEEIEYLLANDIDRAATAARDLVAAFDSLSETRKAVLVNMAFNLGQAKLGGFKNFLAAVEQGRFDDAAREMLDSVWAQQVGNRALRLSAQMREGGP